MPHPFLVGSGGGNDVAGMKDFLRLVADDCENAADVSDCYRTSEPDHLMAMLMGCYRALTVEGGPEGVGHATMGSVVTAIVLIIVADGIFTALLV